MLYQADWERNSPWNFMAAGMADVVLLVANAKVTGAMVVVVVACPGPLPQIHPC